MEKRYYLSAFLLCSIIVCGCANGNTDKGISSLYKNYIEDKMLGKSGVDSDVDYMLSVSLGQNGMLDENGNYTGVVDNSDIDVDELLNLNPISFNVCTNNTITFECYRDQDHKELVYDGCTLSPGDYIYISNIVCNSPYTDCYELDKIRLIDYDINGNIGEIVDEISSRYISNNATLCLHIPDTYTGNDLMIEALGRYYDREINLNAVWKDANGREHDLEGVWKINAEEVNSGLCKIEPSVDYTVSFEFDSCSYYFSGNETQYFRVEDNYVEFYRQNSIGGARDFSISLKKYNTIDITDNDKAIISFDVNDVSYNVGDKSYEITDAKAGEWITFKVKPGYKVSCDSIELFQYEKSDGYKFNCQIPENTGNNIEFIIEKWNNKEVEVSLDKNNAIASFFIGIGNFFSGMFGGNKPEDSLLYIQCGDTFYTYADIQANSIIKMNENEILKIVVNKYKLNGATIVITINEGETYSVNETSVIYEFEFDYESVNKISIEGEE